MKYLALSFLLFSGLATASHRIGPAPVKHLYIPSGFDSNDSVDVVVTGNFPNPCYSRNTVKVSVVENKIDILVTALMNDQKGFCPEMIVPFKELVSVGNLQGGNYSIRVNNILTGNLAVQEASSNAVDEHLYAAIDNVIKVGPDEYKLEGWRYSNCIVLDRVEVISNGKDTLSVLPIMKQVSDFCPMKMTPTSYSVNLDLRSIKHSEPLIHVRTMDGKSFNAILNWIERK